jgi:DNA-binding transcriptional regulator GbsR (MarR family)
MTRILLFVVALLTVVASEGRQYYYAPLGPWGLESTIIHAKALRQDPDMKKIKRVSNDAKRNEPSEEVQDELEQVEEAFMHAVEKVEEEVVHAIDNEVETFFPHHTETKEE